MVVAANGGVKDCDRQRLKEMHLNLYERPDAGFDCGAFKDTLERYITWEGVQEYDELILVNDSCYGPLFPLDEMFHKMDKEKASLDFWTITEQQPFKKGPYCEEKIPYHIQPYFAVIRKKLLHSPDFSDFWKGLTVPENYWEAVENYELKFAAFFAARGYTCGAYVDSARFCKSDTEWFAYVMFDIFRLISECRCPFVKRKAFKYIQETIYKLNAGETVRKTLDYIQTHTAYPAELIWEDLIHDLPPKALHLALHLDYMVPSHDRTEGHQDGLKRKLFVYVRDIDFAEACLKRINTLPPNTDAYMYAEGPAIKKIFNGSTHAKLWNRIDSWEQTEEIHAGESDYLCLIIDDTATKKFFYHAAKLSYIESVWENMWLDPSYVENVVFIFEKEKKLGLLTPPEPYFSIFFTSCFASKPSSDETFTTNHAFWIRTAAIRERLSGRIEKEWLFPLADTLSKAVRRSGFYSGILMEEHWTSVFTANYRYMLEGLTKHIAGDVLCNGEYAEIISVNPEIYHFCHVYKKIYIYGAGKFGHHCLNYLSQNEIEFKGFVVSDGQKEKNHGIQPVYGLSEIALGPDEGIIVGVGKEYLAEVENELKKRKISRFVRCVDWDAQIEEKAKNYT
ncbi:MAG: hypothetical protein HFE84_10125 [Lachnospiraceae bacterium]|nr:hypothetical protein [Lachnospiraceae bacterium]